MSRKIICALLSVLLLAMSACAFAEDGTLEAIQAKGELVIATEGCWAPWTYHDETGELVGFDVEVGKLIAEKLGVTASFAECEWDGILAGVDAGRYDIAINGVEWTEQRAEKYEMSTPYCYNRIALIVRGDNDTITSFEDLNGKKTCNSLGSTYMDYAESFGASAVGVDTLAETLDMVLSGRADATLNAVDSFNDYMNMHPEANLKIVALSAEATLVCIPMPKGDANVTLHAAINQAITELAEEGKLAELSVKYFGRDTTSADAEPAQAE